MVANANVKVIHMKIACSMSAWKDSIDNALAAIHGHGFRYVDIIAIPGWGLVEPEKLVKDVESISDNLRQSLAKHDLTPIGVNAAVPNIYQRDDQSVNDSRLSQVDAICRMMKALHIPVVSFFPGGNWPAEQMEWEKVLDGEVQTLREMLEIAARYDVTLTVEPHAHTPFEKLAQIRRLLEALPQLKVAYDPSHFVLQGITLADTTFMIDRAAHVHIRDAAVGEMQKKVGEGSVDFTFIINELRSRNYAGSISVEYLPGMDDQVGKMLRVLRDAL